MAQEENYIAIVSQRLSKPGDTRYVIIDKQTQQEVDTCNGRGYKSAQAAHKSFAFKMRRQQQSERARQMRSQYQAGASKPSAPASRRPRQQAASQQTEPSLPFASRSSRPADLVSPFVRDDMAPSSVCESLSTASPNRQPAASGQRLSLTSRFSPQRWTSQENTPRPSDLFDFSK
jgi:hypothetical protein